MRVLTIRHFFVSFAISIALLPGCGSDEDRAAGHLESADRLIAEGRIDEALLELHSAAGYAPEDASILVRAADLSMLQGYRKDALGSLREAHDIAPDDPAITLKLAGMLAEDEPDEALALAESVLEEDPDDLAAKLVKALALMGRGAYEDAVRTAREAANAHPDLADPHWALGTIHQQRIIQARNAEARHERVVSPRTIEAAIEANRTYIERDGPDALVAKMQIAGLLAGWPGHRDEAARAWAEAIIYAGKHATTEEQLLTLRRAARFSNNVGLEGSEIYALRWIVRLQPGDMVAWARLLEIYASKPVMEIKTAAALLEAQPDNPEAHIIYAKHLARNKGLQTAIEHLRGQIEAGLPEAPLLAGIARVQLAHRHPGDAELTLLDLKARHPEYPEIALLLARVQLRSDRLTDAAATLEAAIAEADSEPLQVALSRVELRRGDAHAALEAADRAIALAGGGPAVEARRARAHALHAQSEHAAAIAAFKAVHKHGELTPADTRAMAEAHYESGLDVLGKKILIDMIEAGAQPARAALMLLEREGRGGAMTRLTIYQAVEKAYEQGGSNYKLLAVLTEMDLEEGNAERALRRLNALLAKQPLAGRAYLLRARIYTLAGRLKEARQDIDKVLLIAPTLKNDAMEALSTVYSRHPDTDQLLAAMDKSDREGKVTPDRLVLIARLLLQQGKRDRALQTYERALEQGSDLVMLYNDLAYLLALEGRDLDRAEELARTATEAPGENLAAVDTLGFVLLKQGRAESALYQFRFATEHASPPVAEYYYHLGLAMMELDRLDQARKALQRALAINPDFTDASDAERRLRELGGSAARAG